MRAKLVFLVSTVVWVSALVCARIGTAQETEPGERIMNASC